MASAYVYNFNDVYNMSNTSLFKEVDILEYTTEMNKGIVVEESLQKTRLVVQGVLTPLIVAIGLLGNFLNILVLFQPCMRTSTNVYLLVLSVADSVFLVFNFALSLLDCRKTDLHLSAYYFNPFGRFMSNFSGNVGVWVTVVFTVERYIAVCHPIHGKVWCTVSRAQLASISVVIVTLINTIPTLFELQVIRTEIGHRCTPTDFSRSLIYEIGYSWWYVFLFTFIPFICLTIFNIVLIRALLVASRRRQQLSMVSTAIPKYHKSNGDKKSENEQIEIIDNISVTEISERTSKISPTKSIYARRKQQQSKRSTREQNKVTIMLITIVMIFLLCQLPWTALFLYQTYLSSNNFTGSDSGLKIAGNICNILQLVNASVNFYLYSCFSKRFRHTLAKLMLFWHRWNSSPCAV